MPGKLGRHSLHSGGRYWLVRLGLLDCRVVTGRLRRLLEQGQIPGEPEAPVPAAPSSLLEEPYRFKFSDQVVGIVIRDAEFIPSRVHSSDRLKRVSYLPSKVVYINKKRCAGVILNYGVTTPR
jgi:hypothetical protein